MPAEALPHETGGAALPGTVRLVRAYRDVLGRPMKGTVTLTGTARRDSSGQVVLPAPVVVDIPAGDLVVSLPPDTYQLAAALRTADGTRINDTDTVTLVPDQ